MVTLSLATLVIGLGLGRAGEPVQLALVSPSAHSSVTTSAPKVAPNITITETNSISPATNQHPVTTSLLANTAGLSSENEELTHVTIAITKKRPAPPAGSMAAFFNGMPGNGNFGISNFEAGYGQAYNADSIVLQGRNGTAIEEPRYIFFKKIVRF